MKSLQGFALGVSVATVLSFAAMAADYPEPKQGDWIVKDFKFHTGEVMPELKLPYTTVGNPTGIPVVVLHGSGGSAQNMLTPAFAGELFGPGQSLDATKHYIIIPDALGHGKSPKPSDGMKTKFPKYDYSDMVDAQHRLLVEGLKIQHVRLIIGNSMGGMNAWLWGEKYPDYMDTLVPMASQPTAMASRNWMLRRMMLETIRHDPEYNNGNYTKQPQSLKIASVFFGIATAGGTLNYQKLAPTSAQADKIVDTRLGRLPRRPMRTTFFGNGVRPPITIRARTREDRSHRFGGQLGRRRAQPAGDRHHGKCVEAR
jgi:homoserine O-acetyltransferase/O-succinyltransferase